MGTFLWKWAAHLSGTVVLWVRRGPGHFDHFLVVFSGFPVCWLRQKDTNFFLDAPRMPFLDGRNHRRNHRKSHRFHKDLGVQRQVEFNLMTFVADGVVPKMRPPLFNTRDFSWFRAVSDRHLGTSRIDSFICETQVRKAQAPKSKKL